ncbi:MAG: hypothetical protein IKK27_00135 [Alistipes sp.]|nr:hypothetical protein [Alistipes sp.]
MKMLKIYGVKGLMEWQCVIVSGGVKFHFAFTEGTITGYGVTPAKYRTSNPILQNVIESSQYFKSGKIHLVKQIILEKDKAQQAEEAAVAQLKKVEVSCLEDAKEYLAENFGVSRLKLKNKQAIINHATENKIEFVGF